MYRTFTLVNETGAEYPLSSPDFYKYGFLTEPEGLGFEYDNEYLRLGDIFVRTNSEMQQGEFEGVMNFPSYDVYRNFANYIFGSKELTLVYECGDAGGTYYRDCDCVSLDKTEIGEKGILECDISLQFRSDYYMTHIIHYIEVATDEDRRYDIPYSNRYVDFTSLETLLVNDSHGVASFSFTIFGYSEKPRVMITDENDVALYDITFPVTLQAGARLEYSSRDGDTYIRTVSASGVTQNIVQKLDIKNNNFIRIPLGTYKLKVSSDTGVTNEMTYTMYKFYKAV